jgi:uncharacterized protein with gpF-like domain
MPKKTRPIRESRKIEVQYRNALLVRARWLEEHQGQILRELKQQTDAPGTDLRTKINAMRDAYLARFPIRMTQRLAKRFYQRINSYNEKEMNGAFKALGIDLASELTKSGLKDFSNIAIQNQVNLIKSISDDYFDKIENLVYNGVMNGEDFETLGKKIQDATGATKKRAKFIARDQVSSINGSLSRLRAEQAGITSMQWVKTKPSKTKNYTPRQSHIDADGKIFDIDKGLKVDGKYIWPSSEIGCTCIGRYIVN